MFRRITLVRLDLLAVCVLALSGCAPDKPPAAGVRASDAAPDSVARAADRPAGDGACRLLSRAEVRAALPGVGDGTPVESVAQYGMQACQWSGDHGRFTAQIQTKDQDDAQQQMNGLIVGFIDPMKRDASSNVRFETIAGVGDDACAVLEQRDAQKGILTDIAILIVRRGEHSVTLMSDSLSQDDRAATLAALQTLGRQAAERL